MIKYGVCVERMTEHKKGHVSLEGDTTNNLRHAQTEFLPFHTCSKLSLSFSTDMLVQVKCIIVFIPTCTTRRNLASFIQWPHKPTK